MIHLQVHLQVPCYDFCPVQAIAIKLILVRAKLTPHKTILSLLELTQFRAATGGVYKGQGRNQRKLMTYTYLKFLVHE